MRNNKFKNTNPFTIIAIILIIGGALTIPTGMLTIFAGIVLILSARKISVLRQHTEELRQDVDLYKRKFQEAEEKMLDPTFVQYSQDTQKQQELSDEITEKNTRLIDMDNQLAELNINLSKLIKKQATAQNKLNRIVELQRSAEYSLNNFFTADIPFKNCRLPKADASAINELSPTVILNLHSMDIKSLNKAFKENDKEIESVLSKYLTRYTSKSNKSIYQLMVIALRAELQNILIDLKFEKLDVAIEKIKNTTSKYLSIAESGNQNITVTLAKFIGQIEYLFINAAKIEYNYYVKKEQARLEQQAIREQMRIEAQERKALEDEKKKIEKEETKYNDEIARLKEQLEKSAQEDVEKLNARILELQSQLADVVLEKERITTLQNGKAGNVYIISNLGSFGDDVFKVGMTRRSNPQERVNELGDASVPFKFDVHSFIFSQDAVDLEKRLHNALNDKRLNKVNLRKEFFKVPLDEIEKLVRDIDPTVEFTRTMAAQEYRQSLSSDEIYTSEIVSDLLNVDNDDDLALSS